MEFTGDSYFHVKLIKGAGALDWNDKVGHRIIKQRIYFKGDRMKRNHNLFSNILIFGVIGLVSISCQNQGAELTKNGEIDIFSSADGSENNSQDPSPEVDPIPADPTADNLVNCSNVAEFNAELKKIADKALVCSHGSSQDTVLTNDSIVDLKNPSNPGNGNYVFMREAIGLGASEEQLSISYNDADLRRADPINLFFSVKASGTCSRGDFRLIMDEGRSNNIFLGGGLDYRTAARNYTYSARALKNGVECMKMDVDLAGSTKSLSFAGVEQYKEMPMTEDGVGTVSTYFVNGKTWKIKSSENFSSCSANPSGLKLNGSLSINLANISSDASVQLNNTSVMSVELYHFKPYTKYLNPVFWTDEMRPVAQNLKEVHRFSCTGYKNNFSY